MINQDNNVPLSTLYPSPSSLNQPFTINNNLVVCYFYVFDYNQQDISLLVSPIFLGEKIPFYQYFPINQYQYDNYYTNVKYLNKQEITEQEFMKIQSINNLYMKIILFQKQKINQATNFEILGKFNDKIIKKGINYYHKNLQFKNYLFIPSCFYNNKQIDNFDVKIEIQNIQKYQTEKFMNIFEIKNNPYLLQNNYQIYICDLGKLDQIKLNDFIKILGKFCHKFKNTQFTIQDFDNKIRNYYNQMFFDKYDLSLQYLIEKQMDGIENIKGFELFDSIFDFIQIKQNNWKQQNYCLTMMLPDYSKYDIQQPEFYENIYNLKDNYQLIKNNQIPPSFLKIINTNSLNNTGINCQKLTQHAKNISYLKSIEISIIYKEMRNLLDLSFIEFDKFIIAMTPPSLNRILNYENFEFVGDSILKLLSCLYLFQRNPLVDEGVLSNLKDLTVSNKNLKKKAIQKNLHFFIKNNLPRHNNYIPPNFILDKSQLKMKNNTLINSYISEDVLGNKRIADVVEALIASAYLSKFRLFESFLFLKQLDFFDSVDMNQFKIIFFQKIEIDHLLYQKIDEREKIRKKQLGGSSLKVDNKQNGYLFCVSWVELFFYFHDKESKEYLYFKNIDNDESFEEEKDQNINDQNDDYLLKFQNKINYKFKNQQIFKESVEIGSEIFQRLEFIGDAVLDVYGVLSLFQLSQIKNIKLNPEKLHGIKVFLLSRETLSKFFILFKLENIFELNPDQQKEFDLYSKNCKLNDEVKKMWNECNYQSPKFLCDAFEAFVGAVFMDSGFEGVKKILDKYFSVFIYYYLHNYQYIMLDIKQYIIKLFSQKGIQAIFGEDEKEVYLKVNKMDKDNLISFKKNDKSKKILERQIGIQFLEKSDYYINKVQQRLKVQNLDINKDVVDLNNKIKQVIQFYKIIIIF